MNIARRRVQLALLVSLAVPFVASATPLRIVALGDSITQGASSEPDGSPGWVELLPYDVHNVARGGTSSLDWGSGPYFDAFALPALPADLVLVMLGTNDAVGFNELAPVTVEQYRAAGVELPHQLLRLVQARP